MMNEPDETRIVGSIRRLPDELVAAPVTLCVKGYDSKIIISADLKECLLPVEHVAIDLIEASQGLRGIELEGKTYFFKPTLDGEGSSIS